MQDKEQAGNTATCRMKDCPKCKALYEPLDLIVGLTWEEIQANSTKLVNLTITSMCYNKGMANNVGRPVEYTPERIQEIKDAMELYIETHDIPIVAEFAYLNNIRRAALYEI